TSTRGAPPSSRIETCTPGVTATLTTRPGAPNHVSVHPPRSQIRIGTETSIMRRSISNRDAHLLGESREHRVDVDASDGVDRRRPELAVVEEPVAEHRADQSEVETAVPLQCAELLEVVELAVEDVRLGVVVRDVAHQRVAEGFGTVVRSHEASGLDQRVVAP